MIMHLLPFGTALLANTSVQVMKRTGKRTMEYDPASYEIVDGVTSTTMKRQDKGATDGTKSWYALCCETRDSFLPRQAISVYIYDVLTASCFCENITLKDRTPPCTWTPLELSPTAAQELIDSLWVWCPTVRGVRKY